MLGGRTRLGKKRGGGAGGGQRRPDGVAAGRADDPDPVARGVR